MPKEYEVKVIVNEEVIVVLSLLLVFGLTYSTSSAYKESYLSLVHSKEEIQTKLETHKALSLC